MLRAAVQALGWKTVFEPELCGNHYLITKWSKRLPEQLFVRERTVRFRSVKERDTAVKGSADQCDCLLLLCCWPIAKLNPMQPRPIADTSKPLFPNLRLFMSSPCVSHWTSAQAGLQAVVRP
jgi:hypothetical protein